MRLLVYVASLENPSNNQEDNVYSFCKVKIAVLLVDNTPTSILIKYFDITDVFFMKMVLEFF